VSDDDRIGYQYVVLRCVPRVDREEFVNVGVVLYSQRAEFLRCRSDVDADRIRALAPGFDVSAVDRALDAIAAVCEGREAAGAPGHAALKDRFGFVTAPRSTVVQPGPVHGGLTIDPAAELVALVGQLVSTLRPDVDPAT
jgi:Protein of unknown function (DUF3037)